jgi:hypothetical protein
MYRVEIEGRENAGKFPQADLPLTVQVDGESLGHYNLEYNHFTNGSIHCFTPFIKAGSHKLTIQWDNTRAGISLRLQGLRLQALPSSVTQNGVKAWVANRLVAQSGIESGPPQSFVSPACIEGRGKYLSMMTLLAETPAAVLPVQVRHASGDRWYADVPLSASNLTHVKVSYQNGGFVEEADIEWRVTNLMEAQNTTVRKGDSLLFTAVPAEEATGTVAITVNGNTVTTDPSVPVPYAFNEPGLFSVTGTCGNANATIWVRVVEVNLEPVVPVLKVRNHWDCPKLPAGVMLSYDHRLHMQRLYPTQEAAAQMEPPIAPRTNPFKIWNAATYEPRYVLARIGNRYGPIVASTAVQGVHFAVPPESSLEMIARNQDGSQLIEGTYVLSPAVPGLSIRFDLLTSGVTFADGTITKTLTAADFNDLGIATMHFIRAAGIEGSVCNEARVYHNGILVVRK